MLITILQAIQGTIEEIVEKYSAYMKRIALSIIKDEHLAEDIVQNALIKINNNRSKIDYADSGRTKNFIITVTRNVAFSMLKQEKYFEENVQFLEEKEFNNIEGEIDVKAFCDKYGLSMETTEILSALSEVDKDIIVMRFGMGYSCKEIAKIFDMSEDSVYKRCQRARKSLQETMEGVR